MSVLVRIDKNFMFITFLKLLNASVVDYVAPDPVRFFGTPGNSRSLCSHREKRMHRQAVRLQRVVSKDPMEPWSRCAMCGTEPSDHDPGSL